MSRHNKRGRKAASDSEEQLLKDARSPDLSIAVAPLDIPGADLLGDKGQHYYTQIYRTRHEWAVADLILIVTAAAAMEKLWYLAVELQTEPTFQTTKTGFRVTHPGYKLQGELRRTVATSLRDAGVRQRDGHPASDANTPRPVDHVTGATVTTKPSYFDEWMGSNELH